MDRLQSLTILLVQGYVGRFTHCSLKLKSSLGGSVTACGSVSHLRSGQVESSLNDRYHPVSEKNKLLTYPLVRSISLVSRKMD